MNGGPVNTDFNDKDFDRYARQLHATALSSISPQTLAKLRSARHAAAKPAPARHGWRWLTATACSALLAVAIGVQFLPRATAPAVSPQPALVNAAADSDASYTAPLDENPDMYVWLASADAPLLAQE